MALKTDKKAEYPYNGIALPNCSQDKDSFFHDSANVKQWLEELPLASPLESAKQVFKALFDTNRMEMDADDRINTLEVMTLPITQITESLINRYNSTVFPMAEKNYKIALLVREIFRELVIAYKHVIASHIEHGHVDKKRNMHTIAIHRMMHFLNHVLFNSYLIYESYPQSTWHELHLLFTYSSINKLDLVPVEIQLSDDSTKSSTARQLYVKAILLSAASPYQLRQREMAVLYEKLEAFAPMTKLSVNRDESLSSGFIINLHSDKPPIHISEGRNARGKQFFVMQTNNLVERINASKSDPELDKMLGLSEHLKSLLLRNWGEAPQRQYVRTRLNFDLEIAVGLNEIHELVSGKMENQNKPFRVEQAQSKEQLKRSSLFETESVMDDITVLTTDNFNASEKNTGTYLSSQQVDKKQEVEAEELINKQIEEKKTHECKTINESTGGYCIEWPSHNSPKIRVGELIGIQSTTNPNDFALSITRWLKCLANNQILVGIQLLSQTSAASEARSDKVIAKHKTVEFFPALSFSKPSENAKYMILPSNQFNADEQLIIKESETSQSKLKLTALVESTGLFSQYAVRLIS